MLQKVINENNKDSVLIFSWVLNALEELSKVHGLTECFSVKIKYAPSTEWAVIYNYVSTKYTAAKNLFKTIIGNYKECPEKIKMIIDKTI